MESPKLLYKAFHLWHKVTLFTGFILFLILSLTTGVGEYLRHLLKAVSPWYYVGIICLLWFIGIMRLAFDDRQKLLSSYRQTKDELIQIQLKDIGNLKQRTNDLADEILLDLYRHGLPQHLPIDIKHQWKLKHIQQLPSDSNGIRKWGEDRSEYFKHAFYGAVLALRDEFAQEHFKNKLLDDFIKQYNQKESYVGAQEIEDIAQQLKTIAAQIK